MKGTVIAQEKFSYLALGDSYTIGEGVPAIDNFPSQVAAILAKKNLVIAPVKIIAKTGWTTDELSVGIDAASPGKSYDLVSLLIGVNNQYRGRTTDEYKTEFRLLLERAIAFAGGKTASVVVLSIPDWGVTPYAAGRDRRKIARDIDAYNDVNREIAGSYGVRYIDITPETRLAAEDQELLTGDGLHPSGKAYKGWAMKLAAHFEAILLSDIEKKR